MKSRKANPLISVIICTFNTKELTLKCLDRLKVSIKKLGKSVETIVVENGTDGTGKAVEGKYPWVKLLKPGENTGFAKGNNLGIASASKKSKYFLLLNTDALVNPDTLTKSVRFMEENEVCDVLGCRLRLGDGTIQASGGYLPTPFSVWAWIWGVDLVPGINKLLRSVHPKDPGFFKGDKRVGWVMGAYLFMKSEVLKTTRGMDENFFMYMEEVEWCKRINDKGYNIWYTPSFEITHLDKASSKSDPERLRKIFRMEILGIIYYLKKYYPTHLWWLTPAIKYGLWIRVLTFLLTGNRMRKLAYLETLKEI